MGWDLRVLEAVAAHRTGWATTVAGSLLDAGQPLTYFLAVGVALIFAWRFGAWTPVVSALLAATVATAVAEQGKELIGRPRPPASLALVETLGFAMPSSIGALTAAAATPLVLFGLRMPGWTGWLLVTLLALGTATIGASMVYLGAHWLSDVLVGWALGAIIGIATSHLLNWLRNSRARQVS